MIIKNVIVSIFIVFILIAISFDYCKFGLRYVWYKTILRRKVIITKQNYSPILTVDKNDHQSKA